MTPQFKEKLLSNWPRKVLALALSLVIWLMVNQSLIANKSLSNVPVHVINLPPGKTVEGMQPNGILENRASLKLKGNKTILNDLSPTDLIIEVDASGKDNEWVETISRRNLVSTNPSLNLSRGVSEVSSKSFIIKLTKLVTEKIPVMVTQPIGEPPKGYQYIDVWPYRLWITVSGPESTLKEIKSRGVKLTYNLSDISKNQLDDLKASSATTTQDAVSYLVPDSWKNVALPSLSSAPIEVNDSNAKLLRIDFVRYELQPFESPLPINLYFPPKASALSPQKVTLASNELIQSRAGIKVFDPPLFVKGVSKLFLQIVRDMVEIVVIVDQTKGDRLNYSVQFINQNDLEDRYVHTLMSDITETELRDLQPQVREEIIRNRFRNYMNRFRLYTSENTPLNLMPILHGNLVTVTDES